MALDNITKFGEYGHQSTQLSRAMRKDSNGNYYLAMQSALPSGSVTPTISSVTTTDGNWTLLASGLTNVFQWRISELTGDNIQYAYVAVPGENFSVAFGWESQISPITDIYIRRSGSNNITVKLERWAF